MIEKTRAAENSQQGVDKSCPSELTVQFEPKPQNHS